MTTTVEQSASDLYELLAEGAETGLLHGPDTVVTRAVETIDGDASSALTGVAGLPPR
jgi:hypothetical protein